MITRRAMDATTLSDSTQRQNQAINTSTRVSNGDDPYYNHRELIKLQTRLFFVKRCQATGIVCPSNHRYNVPRKYLLEIQRDRIEEDKTKLKTLRSKHFESWNLLSNHQKSSLSRLNFTMKESLKSRYDWLRRKQKAFLRRNQTRNEYHSRRYKFRKSRKRDQEFQKTAARVIVNKSDLQLTDDDKQVFLYGLNFIPTPRYDSPAQELELETFAQHRRRIEWKCFFDNHGGDADFEEEPEDIPMKLRFKKFNRPNEDLLSEETKAYLGLCEAQLRNLPEVLNQQFKSKNNLSRDEQESVKKIAKAAADFEIVVCRSDKDGKIILITRQHFNAILERELGPYLVPDLNTKNIDEYLTTVQTETGRYMRMLHELGAISDKQLLHATGFYKNEKESARSGENMYTRTRGFAKYFTIGAPGYDYPLFKTHKINEEQIQERSPLDIPVRIVTAVSSITTSRVTALLEYILKPLSIKYCAEEYCRDSSHYLQELHHWKQTISAGSSEIHLIAADVCALYPSCDRRIVKTALETCLEQCSEYNSRTRKYFVKLIMYCMENVVSRFDDRFYKRTEGIVTGDNFSVSIANITMRWVTLQASLLQHAELAKRFIDDFMIVVKGSLRKAEKIKANLADVFTDNGLRLEFRHIHRHSKEKAVEFLDVNHHLETNDGHDDFYTTDFVKPTATNRVFVNGKSYHPSSTYKSVLKGEAGRLRRNNERTTDYLEALQRLEKKAHNSDFPRKMTNEILSVAKTWENQFPPPKQPNTEENSMLPWATSHPAHLKLSNRQRELKPSAMVTFKKGPNLSTKFVKFRKLCHASSEIPENPAGGSSSGCGKCSLCGNHAIKGITGMKVKKNMVWETTSIRDASQSKNIKLRQKLNCRNFGIYAAYCQFCTDIYVGQSCKEFKDRWNGHRHCWNSKQATFSEEKGDQAALLKHVHMKHPEVDLAKTDLADAWRVVFVEEPRAEDLDVRETHWRDLLKAKVNIRAMTWSTVR